MFEKSKIFQDLDKSFFLAHYKPRNKGGNDKLSNYLLEFKNGNSEAVKHWTDYTSIEFKNSKFEYDIVLRALGSGEVEYKSGQPLDELSEVIANLTNAKYQPQILQKKYANEPLKRLSAVGRHEALRGIFTFDSQSVEKNASLLIVDDVITTGATIKEMCRTIKSARPDLVIHLFTLTKTFDVHRDKDHNDDIFKSIVNSKSIRKKISKPKNHVLRSDSIQEYGGFFLESIPNHFSPEISAELQSLFGSMSSFDIRSTKPIEPEPLSPEVSPPFNVLYNIIQRGLPTRPSLQIENKFQEAFNLFDTEVSQGGISFQLKKLDQELSEKITDAAYLVDPRIDIYDLIFQYDYSWERLDSTFEEDFYLNKLSNLSGSTPWMIQYVQPQRTIQSIIDKKSHNRRIEQNFVDQRCDFAIQFPTEIDGKDGVIIEVDGPHHEDRAQKQLDGIRDEEVNKVGWLPTIRIPVDNWGQIDSYLQPIVQITDSEYFSKVSKNYNSPLYEDPHGLTALQLVLSPILIGRIQKTILRAILDGHLDLQSENWKICIIERDVPGSSLAVHDLCDQVIHLSKLLETNFDLPPLELQVYSTEQFIHSSLHNVSVEKPTLIENISKDHTEYDLVLDITILARIDYWKPVSFPIAPNSYLSVKSSMHNEGKRKFRTGALLKYNKLTVTSEVNGKKEEKEIPELKVELEYFLTNLFRKMEMRPGQVPILDRALRQNSVIGLLPTGGGKSLTYQLSTLLQPGITLIIDPIKSLMRDQVNSLLINHIDCSDFVNSSLDRIEKGVAHKRIKTGDVLFFFISPERLQLEDFRGVLRASQSYDNYFSYVVIDEAHCVSEWGHNFRTSYLFLGKNAKRFAPTYSGNGATLMGLTATASYDVLADIQRELANDNENLDSILSDDAIVRFETFNRPEIQYEIIPTNINDDTIYRSEFNLAEELGREKHSTIIQLLEGIPAKIDTLNNDPDSVYIPITEIDEKYDRSELFEKIQIPSYSPEHFWNEEFTNAAIIFCPYRTWYFGVTDKFKNNDRPKVGIYDSIIASNPDFEGRVGTFFGVDDKDESNTIEKANIHNQLAFTGNRIDLMIATKAFGMGIDKPNVRFSVHLNYPESLESFVQETGRIGRDGKTALASVVFNDQKFQIGKNGQAEKSINYDRQILDGFYNSSFPGKEKEKTTLFELLSLIPILPITNADILAENVRQITNIDFRFELRTSQNNNDYMVVYKSGRDQIGIIFLGDYTERPNMTTESIVQNTELLHKIAEEVARTVPENESALSWLKKTNGSEKRGIEGLLNDMSEGDTRLIQVSFTNNISQIEARVADLFKSSGLKRIDKLMRDYRATRSIETFIDSLPISDNQDMEFIRKCYNSQRAKQDTEKALYRLALIGLVTDYTIDFNRKIFNVTVAKRTTKEYETYLRAYIRRCYSDNKTEKILSDIYKRQGENYIQQSLNFITEFLYKEIALKRWKAIDAVEEACRIGAGQGNGALKEYIDVYFNSKYGRRGYTYDNNNNEKNGSLADRTDGGKTGDLDVVWEFINIATELDKSGAELVNLKHLRGACVRFLNPNPSNYALLLLKAFSTLILEEVRVNSSPLIPEAINEISTGLEHLIIDQNVGMTELTQAINKFFEQLFENTSRIELKERLKEIKTYQHAYSNRMWLKSFNERFLEQYE